MTTKMIDIRLGPGSQRVVDMFEASIRKVGAAQESLSFKVAQEIATSVRRSIDRQTFGGPPITSKWLGYKTRHGMDPRTLVATKGYMNSITARRRGKGAVVEAGSMAMMLEYGTRKMPARPHWAPTLTSMNNSENIRKFVKEVFSDLLGS